MHPDTAQLAAYLDGVLGPAEHAGLRAHLLTCRACAARLAQQRADAGRIARALATGPAPDVRAAVRVRARRAGRLAWLAPATGLAAGLAAVLLFALLLSGGSNRGTAARGPDLLFVTDRRGGNVVALDAATGAWLRAAELSDSPGAIVYDPLRGRLYVALRQAVVALDPATLAPRGRWEAPQPIPSNANLALDARGARLYLAQPGGVIALALDAPDLALARSYALSATPQALAIAPAGATLFALAADQARLWNIDLRDGASTAQALAQPDPSRAGWLAISRDGRGLYAVLTRAAADGRPMIWRIATGDRSSAAATLDLLPSPWDLELLDNGLLALPRGNGSTGGVELLASDTLSTTARLDPAHDQHHVVAGAGGAFFGLNFTHDTVTRYDSAGPSVAWRTAERSDWQPWDGVFVPGGPSRGASCSVKSGFQLRRLARS